MIRCEGREVQCRIVHFGFGISANSESSCPKGMPRRKYGVFAGYFCCNTSTNNMSHSKYEHRAFTVLQTNVPGKRNTSLSFFTAHERNELKGIWGSRSTRLSRESFLPFGSCQLCLLPAREPVSCPSHGHLFCRECALSNLLAQNKELKRLRKEAERRRAEDHDEKELEDAEKQARDLDDFERVQAGMRSKTVNTSTAAGSASPKGVKRKLEGGSDDLQSTNGAEKRVKQSETNGSKEESSFWIPSKIPDNKKADVKAIKQHPTCPAAAADKPHDITLKGLITVHFTEDKASEGKSSTSDAPTRSCPSCNKALSNSTKAILAKPCGHVLCKPCSDKFQKPPVPSAHDVDSDQTVRCYVCSEYITPGRKRKVKKKDSEKQESIELGLVEISSEGTGFAAAGKNMARKEDVAFQC